MPEAPAVYLDYNATTPIAPEARAAMAPFLVADFGNASSRHSLGRRARAAVDAAREQVAAAVNARPEEVVFTSSGTESNNTIIKGVATLSTRKHVATSAVEQSVRSVRGARVGAHLFRLRADRGRKKRLDRFRGFRIGRQFRMRARFA